MPVTALLDTEIIVGQCLSDAEYQLHVQTTGRHDQKRCLGIRNKWGMWLHSTVDRVVIQTRASGVEHSAEEVRRKRFDAILMKAARLHPMAFYFGAVLLLQRHDVFPLGFETSWLPGPMPEVAKDVAPCEAVEVTMALDGQSMEDDAFDVTAVAPTPEATKAFPAVRYRERLFEPLQIVHVLRRADGIQLDQPQCAVVMRAPIASDGAYLVALEDGTSQYHVRVADMRAATASRGPARSPTVPLLEGYRAAGRQAVHEHAARYRLGHVEWSSPCKGNMEARAELEARPSTRASTACGGHIYFPSLTERITGKRLCLSMGPDDLIQFVGLKAGKAGQPVSLTHGTLRHHPLEQRKANCTGHASGVTQHDCAFLKLTIAEAMTLTADTQLALQADCLNTDGPWARAQFLEVDNPKP
jgi:hypothetical protein